MVLNQQSCSILNFQLVSNKKIKLNLIKSTSQNNKIFLEVLLS